MSNAHDAGHRARRGRPAAQPALGLAQQIAQQMRAKGLTQQDLAARLDVSHSTISRLLSGRTRRVRVSPNALADALDLKGRARKRFLHDCQLLAPRQTSKPAPPHMQSAQPPRGGMRKRRTEYPANAPVAQLVQPLLDAREMSRRELAATLGVGESTVSRIMSGAHVTSHAVSAEGISAALGLQGIARREFLRRAAELGAFVLAQGAVAPVTLRYGEFDFERFDLELRHAEQLLQNGFASQAFTRARELDSLIRQAPFPLSHKAAAMRRFETAMLVGRTQEAVHPWGERTVHAIQTYQRIDQAILSRFAPSEMPLHYARLYERRAPLHRELAAYGESIREFTLAIELFMRHVDDVSFLVTLYRNRAHVWAVQGDEIRWRRDLSAAEQVAARAPAATRRRLDGIILYSMAEGYKRLAGRVPAGDTARRKRFAQSALDWFDKARFVSEYEWEQHRVLAGVSEAQCFIWLDADEASRRANSWRANAERVYPSLLKKIEVIDAAALRRRLSNQRRP